MAFSLKPFLNFIRSEYNIASARPETAVGAYAHAYEFVFALISLDEAKRPIFTVRADGKLIDRKGSVVDLAKWDIGKETDSAKWTAAPGVDAGAWAFLRGVPDVNRDKGLYSEFIREYTKSQYELRFGTEASDDMVQQASNRIAQYILLDILNLSKVAGAQPNPNFEAPTIDDIGVYDAQAAVDVLFTKAQIAGWAGNPFLLPVDHTKAYFANILENKGDTYDLLSVYKSLQDVGFSGDFNAKDIATLFYHTLGVTSVAGGFDAILAADIGNAAFLLEAYGFIGKQPLLAAANVIQLGRGANEKDRIAATSDSEYIHGGGGDDTIFGSLTEGYDPDVIDGGKGRDIFDVSYLTADLDVESTTKGYGKFSLEIGRSELRNFFSQSYVYNIEEVRLGSGNDEVDIRLDRNATLDKLDTGLGNDDVTIRLVAGHKFTELQTGAGNDTVDIRGDGTGFLPKIYLGAGNDTLKSATPGAMVYGGEGQDIFYLAKDYLIADAAPEDRISYNGMILTGGVKWGQSESPWAKGRYGIKYGINTDGELVIRDPSGNETYVANYHASSGADRTAGILVGEFSLQFTTLRNAPKGFLYDSYRTLFGPVLKALTGQSYFKGVDPLVLDLDLDGIELIARTAVSPFFDIDADGFAERGGWLHGDDAFVVRDINGNGKIDNLTEMFGTAGVSGFEVLRAYDSNKDGLISAADSHFASLSLWQDRNGNGITDAGELISFAQGGVASIKLTPTVTTPKMVGANEITRSGQFTFTNGKTGTVGDVSFDVNQRDTKWLGDKTVDAASAALPEAKGFGTLTNLRIAMTDSPALKAAMQTALPRMATTDLAKLRDAAAPVLAEWMKAVPVPAGTPGSTPHADVAIRVGTTAGAGATVYDFAYKVTDATGSYWKLGSGSPVLNGSGLAIARPTYAQVLAQKSSEGSWTTFQGQQIQFLERYLGNALPIGENNRGGTAAVQAAGKLLDLMWDQLNQVAVRMAVQGSLKSFFPDIAYNAETDRFVATTARQLAPTFEAIFKAAPGTAAGAEAHLASWKPLLDVFLQSYVRGEDYQVVSYGYLFQNLVAAYENVGLATTIVKAAGVFGMPAELVRVGTGTVAGGNDADIFYLGAGDQVAKGGLGPDTYVVGRKFGSDVIDDFEDPLKGTPDTLRFAQYAPDQLIFVRDGLDLIIYVKGSTDRLRIVDQFQGQRSAPGIGGIDPDRGVEEIVFANGAVWDRLDIAKAVSTFTSGNDKITGTDRIDFLEGGKGDDILTGAGDGDMYFYGLGYGKDTIVDNVGYIFSDAPDVLNFRTGITADMVRFIRNGDSNDLVIRISDTDQVIVQGQFAATYTGVYGTHWMSRIEAFRFADGTVIDWEEVLAMVVRNARTDGNDQIYGFSVEDVLDGGPGDDFLSGGNENDVYLFGFGYGHDTIREGKGNILSGGTDTVRFAAEVRPADVRISRVGNSHDVTLTLTDGSTLLLQGQLSLAVGLGVYEFDRIERFEFADGTVWTSQTVKDMLMAAQVTPGNDVTYGYDVSEDTIASSPGNDLMIGGSWDDTYLHKQGDGRDSIDEALYGGEDTLVLSGAALIASNLTVQRSADRATATLVFKGVSDTVTLVNQFSGTRGEGIETIRFGNGVEWTADQLKQQYLKQVSTSGHDNIFGFERTNDTITGGLGDDVMTGLGWDDTYVHAQGDGKDQIVETLYGGQDMLILTGSALIPGNVSIQRSGDRQSATLSFKGVTDTILLRNQFGGTNEEGVESIRFGNGVIWTKEQLYKEHLKQVSTAGADTILGFHRSNDVITGGLGNDMMDGLSWDDTYIHAQGDGIDTITETIFNGGADVLRFTGAALSATRAVLVRTDNSLVIRFTGVADIVRLVDQFGGHDAGVETIVFGDGVSWTGASLAARYLTAAYATDDNILGFDTADTIDAGAGNDIVDGGRGNDTIAGGIGNDAITGGAGADTIDGGIGIDTAVYASSNAAVTIDLAAKLASGGDAAGDKLANIENVTGSRYADTLTGDATNNLLTGNAGNDILTGNGGNDRLIGGDGDDLLTGGAGADYADGGLGKDTLSFAASLQAVVADLAKGSFSGGDAAGDQAIGIENLIGSAYADRLTGDANANVIDGGLGNDIIVGGGGSDTLSGGGGNDIFDYDSIAVSTPGSGADRILDFQAGDRLDLAGIDANTILAGDQAFLRVQSFGKRPGELTLTYSASAKTTTLLGDVNGDGVADFAIAFTGDVTGTTGLWTW